ncbi:hypothetical protein [Actinomadura sp. 6N118]|uniref:hypothetical protein n=1 Tax=Actinomadura sp. 6N118 TaxID=3375151 RepID=UPI0037AF76FA
MDTTTKTVTGTSITTGTRATGLAALAAAIPQIGQLRRTRDVAARAELLREVGQVLDRGAAIGGSHGYGAAALTGMANIAHALAAAELARATGWPRIQCSTHPALQDAAGDVLEAIASACGNDAAGWLTAHRFRDAITPVLGAQVAEMATVLGRAVPPVGLEPPAVTVASLRAALDAFQTATEGRADWLGDETAGLGRSDLCALLDGFECVRGRLAELLGEVQGVDEWAAGADSDLSDVVNYLHLAGEHLYGLLTRLMPERVTP